MWEQGAEFFAGNGPSQRASPMVEGFAELIDSHFLDVEQNNGVGTGWQCGVADEPALRASILEAGASKGGECLAEDGMG